MDNKITGRGLYAKFQELMPGGVLKKITPEILNETCNHPSTQPFLKWFCENVGADNILTREEMRLHENLKKSGQWLTGQALKGELAEALKDHPELIPLIESNRNYETELAKAYESEREAYDADLKDFKALDDELRSLNELDAKLAEKLETEEAGLEKLRIQQRKAYADCYEDIEKFDAIHHDLHDALQNLLRVYSEAAEKKGPPITWTQMPLDIFVNQIETYYKCMQYNVQKEHKNLMITEDSLSNSSNASLNTDESYNERVENEKAQELMKCRRNIISSTLNKIEAEIEKKCSEISVAKAAEIYNNGDLKFPHSETQRVMEIAQMSSKRDLLEEENFILESQLRECVERFGKLAVTKILVEEAEVRLARKQKRLKKFEHFLYLARDMGHSTADLLSILMQLELQKFQKIIKLTAATRSYLHMEYTLSTKRTDIMKKLQAEFDGITSSPMYDQNVYNKIFTEIVMNDTNTPDVFDSAVKEYENILAENKRLQEEILETNLDNVLDKLKSMKDDLMVVYNEELNSGATKNFRCMTDDLALQFEVVSKNAENIRTLFNESRKKFKYFTDKISNNPIEREKQILWQKFLSNPDGLKARYDELQSIVERSHFVSSLHSE